MGPATSLTATPTACAPLLRAVYSPPANRWAQPRVGVAGTRPWQIVGRGAHAVGVAVRLYAFGSREDRTIIFHLAGVANMCADPKMAVVLSIVLVAGNVQLFAQDKTVAKEPVMKEPVIKVRGCVDFEVTGRGDSLQWERVDWVPLNSALAVRTTTRLASRCSIPRRASTCCLTAPTRR